MTNVVCFGGGTGLPVLLSGLKKNRDLEISAIVTMFDNGGSSGELRNQFGILPPGDILKCLLMLSENAKEESIRDLFLYRIEDGDPPNHTPGNMMLVGLQQTYGIMKAVKILQKIFRTKGNVYPVAIGSSHLCCAYTDGDVVHGETEVDEGIRKGKTPQRLYLMPTVQHNEDIQEVIGSADAFCVGPGSLYTSIIPNFLPHGVKRMLMDSTAPIIFVSNLLTEGKGMTSSALHHQIEIAEQYIGREVTAIIANTKLPHEMSSEILEKYAKEKKYPILCNGEHDPRYVKRALWTEPTLARHDSKLLSCAVHDALNQLCPA
ncbi:MAG: gluconeogenesis factor YvcK family protein [Patescibacteria group bacterium]